MALNKLVPSYETFLDYLVEKATPQEILAYKATDDEQQRADELTEKNKSGQLSSDEADELHQMMEVNELVMLLKAKAIASQNSRNCD